MEGGPRGNVQARILFLVIAKGHKAGVYRFAHQKAGEGQALVTIFSGKCLIFNALRLRALGMGLYLGGVK